MAIQVSGTEVISNSRVLSNVTGLKTVGGTAILGSGDIAVGGSTTFGAVGTYAILYYYGLGIAQGETKAGADLFTASWFDNSAITADGTGASLQGSRSSTTVSGTWRAMGWADYTDYLNRTRVLLYVRIS